MTISPCNPWNPAAGAEIVEHVEWQPLAENAFGLDGDFIEANEIEENAQDGESAALPRPEQLPRPENPDTAQTMVEEQAALLHLANGPPRSAPVLPSIVDTTPSVDRTLQLTAGDDTDARLQSVDADTLVLSGSNFEDITFERPSNSLTILGLSGSDHLALASLELGDTNLRIETESITVEAGAVINSTADLSLIATAEQTFMAIFDSPAESISLSTHALVDLKAAAITAGAFTVLARTTGDSQADNQSGSLLLTVADSARILSQADITAAAISMQAERRTTYSSQARGALISASGDVEATLTLGTVQSGGDCDLRNRQPWTHHPLPTTSAGAARPR
jgi:hypothetical protein